MIGAGTARRRKALAAASIARWIETYSTAVHVRSERRRRAMISGFLWD
jgi:hypothetical protein